MANAKGGFKRYWPDVAIIACLVMLSLWIRRLTLLDIEAGGDAIRKWFFVKQWLYAGSFAELEWNHHLARFGINIWAFFAQLLWDSSAASYYIAPVAAATAGVVFCYKLGQELSGRCAGLIAALWFATLEPMERAGSQLLPGAFSAAYVAGAAYLLLWYLRYQGSQRWRRVLLVLTALFLFCAYLTNISNLLFVPGFLLVVWLFGKNRRDLLIFLGVCLGLYALETAWYALFTEHATRFEIISNSHRGGTVRDVTRTVTTSAGSGKGSAAGGERSVEKVVDLVRVFWKFLERYQVLWESIKFPLYVFLGASLALAVFAKQPPARAIALLVFVYLFLATFSIRQLSPLKVWMSNEPRYFIVLCPLLLAVNSAFLIETFRRGRDALAPKYGKYGKWLLPFQAGFVPAWALVLSLSIGAHYHDENGKRALQRDYPLKQLRRYTAMFNDAYRRGLPIAERRSRDKKALRLIYSVYLDEALIQRDGGLPSFEQAVKRLDDRHDWLSKDHAGLRDVARETVRRQRGCAYFAHIRGRYLRVSPTRKLPKQCRLTGREGG